MNYTILGSVVNLAAGLEGLNKEHGTDILISEAVYDRVKGRFGCRFVGSVVAKGMVAETRIYRADRGNVMKTRAGFGARLQGAIVALSADARCASAGHAEDAPIKVGILHSMTGTMAISEAVLADTVRMLIEQQNAKGGLLGRKLEPVIVDPASDPDLFGCCRKDAARRQGRGGVRRLDLGVAEVDASGVREAQRPALLSRSVRGPGKFAEHLLHRRGSQPAGIPAFAIWRARGRQGIKRWFLLGTD